MINDGRKIAKVKTASKLPYQELRLTSEKGEKIKLF